MENERIKSRSSSIVNYDPSDIYEYDTQKKKKIIIFKKANQNEVKISIDFNRTMGELIKFYFKIINRQNLYGDESILFMKNAKLIPHDSNDLIKNYFEGINDGNIIVVTDLSDKIN